MSQTPPKEIVVFLPFDNSRPPLELAKELTVALDVGRVEFGVDALTGGVEVRFFYQPDLLLRIRAWLEERHLLFDINLW